MATQGTQFETVAIPKRLPLVIQPENREESTDKDAKLINGYMERSPEGEEYWVYKRPGLAAAVSGSAVVSGIGRGIYNWQGYVFTVFGGNLYYYASFPATAAPTLAGAVNDDGTYKFSSTPGSVPKLQLSNGRYMYNYDFTGGLIPVLGENTLVTAGAFQVDYTYEIAMIGTTDFILIGAASNTPGVHFVATGAGTGTGTAYLISNFPNNAQLVPGIAYQDGTTYVLDKQAYIHGSDSPAGLNAPDQWSDLTNLIGAQIEPDAGVCIAKQLVYVLALKQWSTEVFYNAGNPPGASPLAPVQGAKMNFGCVTADSLQDIDGALLWVATNRGSAVQIIMVDNLKPVVVSTKAIERLLSEASFAAGNVASMGIKYEGHRFYILTLKSDNLTLVYDLTDKLWSQWTDADGNYFKGVANTFYNVLRLVQHETNGMIYFMGSEYYTDAGAVITTDLYTPNFDGGVRRRKHLNVMEFIGDQTEGSTLQVRVNDADYASTKWSSYRLVDMSVPKPVLINCGTFMRRAVHIRHQSPTRMRLQAIELQLDVGTL